MPPNVSVLLSSYSHTIPHRLLTFNSAAGVSRSLKVLPTAKGTGDTPGTRQRGEELRERSQTIWSRPPIIEDIVAECHDIYVQGSGGATLGQAVGNKGLVFLSEDEQSLYKEAGVRGSVHYKKVGHVWLVFDRYTWMYIELDQSWDVLGPFPIHAREQHLLSPAYPLDLSSPIDTTLQYPTSLSHASHASWSQTTADPDGSIHVSHPAVPWDQIRASQGWAGLQHLNILRGWLSVHPLSDIPNNASEPFLRTELLQGAFITILPPPDSTERKTHVPEWHCGNIYALERAPVQLVRLPIPPARNTQTRYEVIICAPYEIRLFGDPLTYSSYPILTLKISVSLQFPYSSPPSHEKDGVQHSIEDAPLQEMPAHSIVPYIVDGTPFGEAIGIAVQCHDFGHRTKDRKGHWSIINASLAPASVPLPSSLAVQLLSEVPIRISPTQTRIIPLSLHLSSSERIPEDVERLHVELTYVPDTSPHQTATNCPSSLAHGDIQRVIQAAVILKATLPLTHVPLWTREEHVPILASYFFANSMPSIFVVKPPKEAIGDSQIVSAQHNKVDTNKCRGNEPILALHGAGVDIHTQSFWPDSLPRQKYAWVVMPEGRTAWGLDWHGPSAADAFAAITALSRILSSAASGRWAQWGFDSNTRVILMGHSNGGQGAWYMASRWPDRVCAVVPAAGYIKSQAYVPWCMSRFAHFADPQLRAVLDTSLTPDDNDLFLGNLIGKPVLALHGGEDNNVPVWHTREQVGILRTWDPDTDVTYYEDSGQPHWYFEILCNERVQAFLDRVYFSSSSNSVTKVTPLSQEPKATNFTLTVAVPVESGSLNGWQILALTIPGLLGRLQVTTDPEGCAVSIRPTNVSVFSLDLSLAGDLKKGMKFVIDGDDIPANLHSPGDIVLFARDAQTGWPKFKSPWKILPCPDRSTMEIYRLRAPPRRLQSILSTNAPLTLLVPFLRPSPELSAALRIAHALQLFHALDAQIVSVADIDKSGPNVLCGNLVVIGCADAPLVRHWLADSIWCFTNKAWHVGSARFDRPSSAILFCQPHPYDGGRTALFVQGTDASGLERAVRLFPIRTGVLSPDWLVVDGGADAIGAAGVQGAGVYGWKPTHEDIAIEWVWNERMSWLD